MVRGNRLHRTTKRRMLNLQHYKFKQRLLSKSNLFTDTDVKIVCEAYTSKTCGLCGELKNNLGGNKTFKCDSVGCGFECDRDVNGARNIYLKYLTKNS